MTKQMNKKPSYLGTDLDCESLTCRVSESNTEHSRNNDLRIRRLYEEAQEKHNI